MLLLCLLLAAQEPTGTARIRQDAGALAPKAATSLGRLFLQASDTLPEEPPRTLYFDPASKAYLLGQPAKLKPVTVDYYNTRYGSPLAYVRPMEILGGSGLDGLAGSKVLDFGCGGIGPLRLMAGLGAEVVGVDIDPMLATLYSAPDDQGPYQRGRVSLLIGRYPADGAIKARAGGGYDLILSKNTLKRGYVHPESGKAFIDLGMDDRAFLKTLHAALKPGGRALIYNLGPAQGRPYKAMADTRSPFSRADWEAAGFKVEAFDRDDTPLAREMGEALGWGQGMDLAKDLFATYTLARKP